MAKLNQIVAVEKGEKARTEDAITAAFKAAQKPEPFSGILKVYKAKNEEGEALPGEAQKVILIVPSIVTDFTAALSSLFDVTATKVYANTTATADIVINGTVLLPKVPIEYLLFLEKRLTTNVMAFLDKIPTLDPAINWHWDPNSGSYASDPVVTNRTKKVRKSFIVVPATDKHPAQAQVFDEDEFQGTWTTTKLSGAVPVDTVKVWKDRTAALIRAVKMAREEANMADVIEVRTGQAVFDVIFSPITADTVAAASTTVLTPKVK